MCPASDYFFFFFCATLRAERPRSPWRSPGVHRTPRPTPTPPPPRRPFTNLAEASLGILHFRFVLDHSCMRCRVNGKVGELLCEVIVVIPHQPPANPQPTPTGLLNAHPLHHFCTVAAASHAGHAILINCKGCWSDQERVKRPGLRLHVDETSTRAPRASLM